MRFFLNINNLQDIKNINNFYLADGVYVDPIFLKRNDNAHNIIKEINEIIDGPIIIPMINVNPEEIIKEANALKRITENICIQMPINFENLKLCRSLINDEFYVDMTLCFSVSQAILAAKMGATFISISIAKCNKIGLDKFTLLTDIRQVLDNYTEFQTEIIITDIEDTLTIYNASKIGIEASCLNAKTLNDLTFNVLTEQEENNIKQELDKIVPKNNNLY